MEDVIRKGYEDLLKSVMREYGISEVCDSSERYFSRLSYDLESDSILKYYSGISFPFRGLCFDYSLDYADLLYRIERDMFLTCHGRECTDSVFAYKFFRS